LHDAATSGDIDAMVTFAARHFNDPDPIKNKESETWALKAAVAGSSKAALLVGKRLLVLMDDKNRALPWLERAASYGNSKAIQILHSDYHIEKSKSDLCGPPIMVSADLPSSPEPSDPNAKLKSGFEQELMMFGALVAVGELNVMLMTPEGLRCHQDVNLRYMGVLSEYWKARSREEHDECEHRYPRRSLSDLGK